MIVNKTRGVVIAEDLLSANTFFKRMKGLLGRQGLGNNQAMIIKPCNSIHTFFMRFPIDVLFIGADNKVINAIANIPPWRISPLCLNSHFVVELPAGKIQSTSTLVGDQFEIKE